MIKQFPEDAKVLNSYSWRMTELEVNLEDALEKVRQAIFLTNKEPHIQANILDTEAEVLWKLGRFNEAIKVIERAIAIDSKNQYFKDQKRKFLNSINTKEAA